MTLSPGDIVWAWHVNDSDGPKEYKVNDEGLIYRIAPRCGAMRPHWFHIYLTKAEATDAYERQAKVQYKAAMATVRRLRKEGG